jgi:ammonia channel protein AmtB
MDVPELTPYDFPPQLTPSTM